MTYKVTKPPFFRGRKCLTTKMSITSLIVNYVPNTSLLWYILEKKTKKKTVFSEKTTRNRFLGCTTFLSGLGASLAKNEYNHSLDHFFVKRSIFREHRDLNFVLTFFLVVLDYIQIWSLAALSQDILCIH